MFLRQPNFGVFSVCHRGSRPEMFCKKGVLRNFTKFTGKHMCQSLFFKKLAGLKPATLLKKRLWPWCFPVNFTKFLRAPFYIEHLWWLLLLDSNFMFIAKIKLYFSLIQFLLLLSEMGLRPESYLALFHARASCLRTGCL